MNADAWKRGKVYKKEVLNNLVSGWNKVGFLSCKIYMEKELGRMKRAYDI